MELAKVSSRSSRTAAGGLAVGCVAALMLLVTPPSHAQDPGVVYEPGSPSDKEYAIPLDEARRDAGGDIPGNIESRAFGIGLSRRGDRGAGRSGGSRSRAERGAADRDTAGRRRAMASDDFSERLADAQAAGAASFWRLAPILLVLLPGLLVGFLLARRAPQQPAT